MNIPVQYHYSPTRAISVNGKFNCQHEDYDIEGGFAYCNDCGAIGIIVHDVDDEYDGTPGSIRDIQYVDWNTIHVNEDGWVDD